MSKEHVMRSALSKYLPPLVREFTWQQNYRVNGTGEKISKNMQVPQSAFEWTVNDVCKTCNEGWLHDHVETPAEAVVASAMQGATQVLSLDVARRVALWATKTAVVRALMDPTPRAVPPEHYEHIRLKLEPPPNTLVWLANTEYCRDPFMRHTRHGLRLFGEELTTTSHFTSIVYGHMALYVIGASDHSGLWIYEPTIANIESRDVLQVWPPHQSPAWPVSSIPLTITKSLTEFVPVPGYANDTDVMLNIHK